MRILLKLFNLQFAEFESLFTVKEIGFNPNVTYCQSQFLIKSYLFWVTILRRPVISALFCEFEKLKNVSILTCKQLKMQCQERYPFFLNESDILYMQWGLIQMLCFMQGFHS